MAQERPNLLVIMSDQHAPHFSGPYGHPVVRTPNMDRLAAEGVVFDSTYSPSPVCVPARMSFMTGRYVHHTGVWDNGVPLREDAVTWAHRLRAVGYNVALSGKMHFRGHDQLHGFEVQLGRDVNAGNPPPIPDWSRPLSEIEPMRSMPKGPGYTPHIEADDLAMKAAQRYLLDPARRKKPWALVVGFASPHPPFIVPPSFYEIYSDVPIDMPIIPEGHLAALHPALQRMRRARGFVDPAADEVLTREVRASYYGLISYVDDGIGRLLKTLEESGQVENSIIAYTSDHGELLGEHGMWYKCNFFEQSVRVPLLISCPSMLPCGKRVPQPVSLLDLTATIVDLAHATEAREGIPPLDGNSLIPLVLGDSGCWRDEVLSEFYAKFSTEPMAMLRRGRYKLNYYHGGEPEVFDLEADPGEFHDLAGDPSLRSVREELLRSLFNRWNPDEIERRVRISQAERQFIRPYLFNKIDTGRAAGPSQDPWSA